MKLTFFRLPGAPAPIIKAASSSRPWMDRTAQAFANRCLPLRMANAHGWEIQLPEPVVAHWHGEASRESLEVLGAGMHGRPSEFRIAESHFGHGVLTFHVGGVFRTPKNFDLFVQGPTNHPIDGFYPLAGVVETDWLPFTFTMNWQFTRPGRIYLPERFPYAFVFPIRRPDLPAFEPEIRDLESDKLLLAEYVRWSESRRQFAAGLEANDPKISALGWQKTYMQGAGGALPHPHRTGLRLREFEQ